MGLTPGLTYPRWLLANGSVTGLTMPNSEEYIAWDDLRFPAQGINPAGAAAPPTVDATTYPGTLLFSSSSTNVIAGVAQMPHAWKAGSEVRPHIHWAKSTSAAGGVIWQFKYVIADIHGTFGAYSDWETMTVAVSDADTAHLHALKRAAAITMTGKKESTMICWQLQRKHDDAADDYGADARLFEVDFHYQVSKFGTITEIPE